MRKPFFELEEGLCIGDRERNRLEGEEEEEEKTNSGHDRALLLGRSVPLSGEMGIL